MKTLKEFLNEVTKVKVNFKGLKPEIDALVAAGKDWIFTNKGPESSSKFRNLQSATKKVDNAVTKLTDKISSNNPLFGYAAASADSLRLLHTQKTPSAAMIKKIIQKAADENEGDVQSTSFKKDDYVTYKGKEVSAILKVNSNGTYDIEKLEGDKKVVKKVKSSDLKAY